MLIDARTLEDKYRIEADVCIVGAGPGGITLALTLASKGITSCIIESGGLTADAKTLDLNRGHSLGLPYSFGPGFRSRHLGGGSNCWGGFSQRWDAWDFYNRPWVRDSGWPFSHEALDSYYRRAERLLQIHPEQYEASWWAERLSAADLARFPLDPARLRDTMSALTPIRFGEQWSEQLKASGQITVLLWANACEVQTDKPARQASAIRVRTLNERGLTVSAKRFVLAAGGIETPRLMLASNKADPAGLGNGYGLVGRYFMDHPRIYWGKVELKEPFAANRLYDIKFNFIRTPLRASGAQGSGVLTIPYEVQRRERLLNSQVWLRSVFHGETTDINQALSRMQQRLIPRGRRPGFGLREDLTTLMISPIGSTLTAAGHLSCSRRLVSHIALEGIFEPEPNPQSRVLLGSEVDATGMPRAQVDWRLTELDRRGFERTMKLVTAELEARQIAHVVPDEYGQGNSQERPVEGTWHHMGTTRMHASPSLGVVDQNCRVHGLSNVFVAGASVFPTGGANHPTLQLLALSYRLADHLADTRDDDQAAWHGMTPVAASTSGSNEATANEATANEATPTAAKNAPAAQAQ